MGKPALADEVGVQAEEIDEFEAAIWPPQYPIPTRTVRCRSCGQRNRVEVPRAVLAPERHDCGTCGKSLFLSRDQPLVALSAAAYQHSLDDRSLSALKSVPGASGLMRALLGNVGDRSARVMFMSDAIRCDEEQFPELLALMDTARGRLDIGFRPTMFLGESPHMNAMTTGVREPIIVVRSALLDQMTDEELVAVLGHELGHLHADHPLYHSVARAILQGSVAASPLLRLLGLPLHRMLLGWSRCAELTADRAALLASRDLKACISMMLTFAAGKRPGISSRTSMRLAPFIRQCRELARMQVDYSLDSMLGGLLVMDRTHPHLAWRVMHLLQWVEHGNYLNILGGDYIRRRAPASSPQIASVVGRTN